MRLPVSVAALVALLPWAPADSSRDPPEISAPLPLSVIFENLGAGYAQALLLVTLTGDELVANSVDPEYATYDDGNILDPSTALLQQAYIALHAAVGDAKVERDDLTLQYETAPSSVEPCDLVAANVYAGLGLVLAHQLFGEWDLGGTMIEGSDTDLLLAQAVEYFSHALEYGDAEGCSDLHIAYGLRARAYMAAGAVVRAQADAHRAVASGDWTFGFTDFGPGASHAIQAALDQGEIGFGPAYTVTDASGAEGLLDPLDGVVRPTVSDLVAASRAGTSPGLIVVSGRELQLILAEASLRSGDLLRGTSLINAIRARDGVSPYPTMTAAQAGDALLHERREGLFAQGRRLGDLYGAGVAAPEWDVASDAATAPGSLLPIPSTPGTCTGCPDRIQVSNRSNAIDGIAVLDGKRTPASFDECFDDELVLEQATVATLSFNAKEPSPCRASAVIFEHLDRMIVEPDLTGWTDAAGDLVPLSTDTVFMIPLVVWRRSATAPADAEITTDIDDASETFGRNRVGLRFDKTIRTRGALPSTLTCDMRDALGSAAAFAPGLLNMYYVDQIDFFDGSSTVHPMGIFCPDPTPGATVLTDTTYVLIDRDQKWSTTVAHELAHALLRIQSGEVQHPNMGGLATTVFPTKNLMFSYLSGTTESSVPFRDSLSLGQAYRMNVHRLSWLNRARQVDGSFTPKPDPVRDVPAATFYCPCDWVGSSPCLPLGLHYTSGTLTLPSNPYAEPECFDEIQFKPGVSTLSPLDAAALLDGDALATAGCDNDLVALSRPVDDTPSGTHRLWFDNLLDPLVGSCSAEYFILSRHYRVQRAAYTAASFTDGTGSLDERTGSQLVMDPASFVAPLSIPVSMWHAGALSWDCTSPGTIATLTTLQARTQELFRLNRTGVQFAFTCESKFTFDPNDGSLVCSPPELTAGRMNVYWVQSLPSSAPGTEDGFTCPDGKVAYVRHGGGSSVTELAHQIGHAFGLDDLTHDQPGFVGLGLKRNIMKDDAATVDALRDRFTIGQVIRMYYVADSYVRDHHVIGSARCAGGADGQCPELWVDVPR